MAIPGHQYMSSEGKRAADGTEYAAGTPIHQVIALLRAIQPGRFLLQLQQNALRLMQIVKALNFRNVHPVYGFGKRSPVLPLVSRHMIRIDIPVCIPGKLLV